MLTLLNVLYGNAGLGKGLEVDITQCVVWECMAGKVDITQCVVWELRAGKVDITQCVVWECRV